MGGYTNVLNLYLRKLFIYYVNNTLAVMLKNQTSPNIATILTTFELCRQIFLVK